MDVGFSLRQRAYLDGNRLITGVAVGVPFCLLQRTGQRLFGGIAAVTMGVTFVLLQVADERAGLVPAVRAVDMAGGLLQRTGQPGGPA